MTKLLSISLKYFYLVSSSGNCSPPAAKKSKMDPGVAQRLDEPFECHETAGTQFDPRDISSILKNNPWMGYGVAHIPDELVKCRETAGTQSDPSPNSHKLENDSWMDPGVAQSLDQILDDYLDLENSIQELGPADPGVAQSLDQILDELLSEKIQELGPADPEVAQSPDQLLECHETAGTQSDPSTNSHKLENDSRMGYGVAQSPDQLLECHETAGTQSDPSKIRK
ncbi:hypothetical protein GINT2_000519 [Glugoides intestinalis]